MQYSILLVVTPAAEKMSDYFDVGSTNSRGQSPAQMALFRRRSENRLMPSRALLVALATCQCLAAAVGDSWSSRPTTTRGWRVHSVVDYGATGDGRTVNTRAIQAAIDAAGDAGGGQVLLPASGPAGNLTSYMSGSLFLRSNARAVGLLLCSGGRGA